MYSTTRTLLVGDVITDDKCISEGLMHVAARYHGTPDQVHQIRAINVDWPDAVMLPYFVALRQKVSERTLLITVL